MENHSKKLTLQIPLSDVEDGKIDILKDLLNTHKGDKQLFFVVYEESERIKLTMPSRKHKINISKELLEELHNKQIQYKLN